MSDARRALSHYLNTISDLTRRGDAREESYYPALKDLLETLAQEQGYRIQVTVLPKKTEAGSPDFRIWDGCIGLSVDFPRVPFTADPALFRRMAALGQELIDLHLLRRLPQPPRVKYQGQGSDTIEFVRYEPASGRVAINGSKCFEGITPQMWEYQIGGYQVLEKYLKDRKGRPMEDPIRYIHIATAIARTIELQREIDPLFHEVERAVLS